MTKWVWPYYSRDWHSYYGNGQPGDFFYAVSIFAIGPWQFRWYSGLSQETK